MDKTFSINIVIMVVLSLVVAFVSQPVLDQLANKAASDTGFTFGRATGLVLLPLFVTAIPSGIYKSIKGKSLPGFYIILWFLWVVMGVMALYGAIVQIAETKIV